MPLQNRVDPAGNILRDPARGMFMGNRGGPLHDAAQQIVRKQKSQAWITCLTGFKNRRRTLMHPGRYTELFFLDEATALAAGHRPCFECRRRDALAFSETLARSQGVVKLKAPQIDALVARDRAVPPDDESRRIEAGQIKELPDGVMIRRDSTYLLVLDGRLRPWSFSGYGPEATNVRVTGQTFHLVTPGVTIAAIRQGYRPILHPSATD
ncbi:MAG: hypothetical protein RIC18_10005 [Hoeflea sp.]|uniref:hypothetical protein n=1 Tax=Hoeflea sp. TaxID=1940281 RepID=UPI0032EA9958